MRCDGAGYGKANDMSAGYVIYDGPSMIDGAPIVVIACALEKSRNAKTGHMVQTYILRKDMHPIEAVKAGADVSICGDCKHRGDGTGGSRSCYVTLVHGPSHVYRSYLRGAYEVLSPAAAGVLLAGRMIRLGTYGDPAAVPIGVWHELVAMAKGWTGYSHRTEFVSRDWSLLVMASVDNEEEKKAAEARGFRTFRVGASKIDGEVLCPASAEAGKKAVCADCRACMGLAGKARASIYIPPHGSGKRYALEREAVA